MRNFAAIVVLLVSAAAGIAQPARPGKPIPRMQTTGFPNYCGESLELFVGRGQELVRATILSVDGEGVTARVRETIRGSCVTGSTLNFAAGGWQFVAGQDVVLSLADEHGKKSASCSLLDHPIVIGQRPYYAMDLKPLNTAAEIMGAVQNLAAHPIDPHVQNVHLFSGGRILIVPAEPRLQSLAQSWAADKTVYKRLLALQALEPFKSDGNIAMATALLADTRSQEARHSGKWQAGRYQVREAAATLLKKWNAPTPDLPMSGPFLTYRPLVLPHLSYFIAPALLVAVLMVWGYHRRGRALRRVAACIFMVALVGALATLWLRSRSRVDELMFAVGSSHHELASYGSGIQYQVLRDWNDDERELVFGSFDRALNDEIWSIDSQNPASRRAVLGITYASGATEGPGGSIHRSALVQIPYWLILSLAMIPMAMDVRHRVRQLRRRRLGLCRHCGYDLRESPSGVCPECGNPTPATFPAASALLLQTRDEISIGGHPVGM